MTAQPLLLLLDRLRDPGNLGSLLRTADAVGASAVLLLPPCVDPFDPKVLRASMGSLFSLPVVQVESVPTLLTWLQDRACRSAAPTPRAGNYGRNWTGAAALRWRWATRRRGWTTGSPPAVSAWPCCRCVAEPNRSTSPWRAAC